MNPSILHPLADCFPPDEIIVLCHVFRSSNVAQRKRYVQLVDSVRDMNGDVKIFSSLHVSGERESMYTISSGMPSL